MDKEDAELLKKFLKNKIVEIDKEVQNSLKLRDSMDNNSIFKG